MKNILILFFTITFLCSCSSRYLGKTSKIESVVPTSETDCPIEKISTDDCNEVKVSSIDDTLKGQIAGKPVIYLYPEKKTRVSVKFDFKGDVFVTYPEYNQGWDVIAYPNGKLINETDKKEYSYLFWEGDKKYTQREVIYDSGFVVSRDSVIILLQNILPEIGLKPQEYNEFIVFWLPYLRQNEWNFIHFRIGENYKVISENHITPKPDTEIRVFMDFKKVEKYFDIKPQKFITPARNGFTLVEWGGCELRQDIKINKDNKSNQRK